MSIFKKQETPSQKPRERTAPTSRGTQNGDGAISIIASGMKVVGDIWTEGTIRIEGTVHGTIRAGKSVVLGQAGTIQGDVFTEEAIIGGKVSGSIVAANRLELQGTSVVEGEIRTRAEHLKLEEGSRFEGQVHMIDGAASTTVVEAAIPSISSGSSFELAPTAEVHNGWSNGGVVGGTTQNVLVAEEILGERQTGAEAPLLL